MGYENNTGLGVVNHYGPRGTDTKYGGQSKSTGKIKRAEWTFTYDDLPVAASNNLGHQIPANATIVSAKFIADEAWTTGTALNVGLYKADGSGVVDADAFDAIANPAAGDVVVGDGALVGASIGSVAAELQVTDTVGDYDGGKATVIVEYYTEV